MSQNISDSVDPAAHLFHEALEQLGWNLDAKALSERVKRLDIGLPAEDEFSMLVSWMGKCKLVHKLDELQSPPESKQLFQVPDLMAIFESAEKSVAVLIEVKTSNARSLSWRPDYYEGLQNYGKATGLPVLVAWKHPSFGWSLVELKQFTQPNVNYKMPLVTALKCNLLGLLAGDFGIVLKAGVGFHLRMRKNARIAESIEADVSTEEWHTTIDEAYFTDCKGQKIKKLEPGLWPIFLATGLEDVTSATKTHIHKGFVVPEEEFIQFAHTILPLLLSSKAKPGGAINWRQVLANHEVPCNFAEMRESAVKGIQQDIVRYIIDPVPAAQPAFLS